MEILGGVLAAIVIAILISAIFYFAFNARGPWGSLWTFFLVLLLVIWAANLWIRPIGPVYWGVSWVPLIFIGLIFALLLAAIPTYDDETEGRLTEGRLPEEDVALDETQPESRRIEIERQREAAGAAVAIGWIFWIFIIFLLIAIFIGLFGYAA